MPEIKPRHPLAGKTVRLKQGIPPFVFAEAAGVAFRVEDWACNVFGRSVWCMDGNPVALEYAVRTATTSKIDENGVYGKVGIFAHIVHDSEIEEVIKDGQT